MSNMCKNGNIRDQIARLAREYRLADIYVFGSRAKETADRMDGATTRSVSSASDVDIAIRPLFGEHLSPKDLAILTTALEDVLDVARVDLMLLSGSDPFLALEAIRGELLYASDSYDQSHYELFVLRRAGDLAPFKKERTELILRGQGR